jgi:hypothetical protein
MWLRWLVSACKRASFHGFRSYCFNANELAQPHKFINININIYLYITGHFFRFYKLYVACLVFTPQPPIENPVDSLFLCCNFTQVQEVIGSTFLAQGSLSTEQINYQAQLSIVAIASRCHYN